MTSEGYFYYMPSKFIEINHLIPNVRIFKKFIDER